MKALLSLCFVLFFVCANSTAQDASAVLDISGDELKVGNQYYVMPAIFGPTGGGLILSNYPTEECPITVSRDESEVNRGIPCSFYPANSEETVIYLSKSLNVQFKTSQPCANSTVWKIGNLDAYTRARLIQIGGELGNPGCETFNNWFKIEKGSFRFSYKFVSNPDDVCSDTTESRNVGSRSAFGQRPLVLNFGDAAFEVVFIKVDGVDGNKANKLHIAV